MDLLQHHRKANQCARKALESEQLENSVTVNYGLWSRVHIAKTLLAPKSLFTVRIINRQLNNLHIMHAIQKTSGLLLFDIDIVD